MQKIPLPIKDACVLKPEIFGDFRGFFFESWNRFTFNGLGIDVDFVQDNHSRSGRGVLRGMHYQVGESVQGKLVWVTSGEVYDVIVDLRLSSPTFGQWCGHRLDAHAHHRVWVPPGCAHGFLVISETADFHYKCTEAYAPARERILRWNDSRISINWPLAPGAEPVVSAKDAVGCDFDSCEKFD